MKHGGKTVHPLIKQRFDCFRCNVAAGKTCTTGGDDNFNIGISCPINNFLADFWNFIANLVKQWFYCFRCNVAPGKTGTTRGDNNFNIGIGCPINNFFADFRNFMVLLLPV